MISIPDGFYDGAVAICVTMEQYTDLVEQFSMDTIPIWNPDFLTKWVMERTEEDDVVHVYWDISDEMVSCFSVHSEDVYDYTIYQYEDLIIPDPEQTIKTQSLLDLL